MSTENRSAEDMMNEILLHVKEIEDLEKMIEAKKMDIDKVAHPLKQNHPEFVASLSTKTGYNGVYYSIRSRHNDDLKRQVAYVCASKEPFGSWLKKTKQLDK